MNTISRSFSPNSIASNSAISSRWCSAGMTPSISVANVPKSSNARSASESFGPDGKRRRALEAVNAAHQGRSGHRDPARIGPTAQPGSRSPAVPLARTCVS